MIQSLIHSIRDVCLELPEDVAKSLWFEPTTVELADAVWLATQIGLSKQIKSIPKKEAVSQKVEEKVILQQPEIDTSSVVQEDFSSLLSVVDTESEEIAEEYDESQAKFVPERHFRPKPTYFFLPDSTSDTEYYKLRSKEGGSLHSPSTNKRKSQQRHGRPFRTLAATMLPDPLGIERALRPLMRRVESRKNMILDEEATVQQVAEERVWWPVLQGQPERWFEVELVVDQSPSMVIWQQTFAELRDLFERHGAFRNVRTWSMVTDKKEVRIFAGAGATLNYAHPCYPHELVDPIGRRLIIVVTDCVSPVWHNGEMIQLLELWGQSNPVAMLQMLPRRLWSRSALREATRVKLQASTAGLPNTKLKMDTSACWFDDKIQTGFKIPVLTIEPKSLATWANMIVGKSYARTSGFVFKAGAKKKIKQLLITNRTIKLSAAQRVQRFYATASPTAQKLASYLAAAPLTLPVMRLLQEIMLPQSQQVHLAEVFLGGLLKQENSKQEFRELLKNTNSIKYDFHEGVRVLLLDSVLIPDALKVIQAVSKFLEHSLGKNLDFQALLSDPRAFNGIQLDEQSRPFAVIQAEVLRRLGGEYARLARRIEKELVKAHKVPFEEMQEGMVLHGVVTNIKDYGAFVDVGGVVGLLHKSDMAWKTVKSPQEILNIGDENDVKVLQIDRERGRVSLGLKQMTDDPWIDIAQRYSEGSRFLGKVTNVLYYGCFVEIEEGVEGLVHKSEMDSSNENPYPSKLVKKGDEVEVVILDIDEKLHRLSLSFKQYKYKPLTPITPKPISNKIIDEKVSAFISEHPIGSFVKGTVSEFPQNALLIQLTDDIQGIVNKLVLLYKNREIIQLTNDEQHFYNRKYKFRGGRRISATGLFRRAFKKGDEIEFEIVGTSVSKIYLFIPTKEIKAKATCEVITILNFITEHINNFVIGIVTEVDKKVIVQLADNVKGFFAIKSLGTVPKLGDEIKGRINNMCWKTGMIILSAR